MKKEARKVLGVLAGAHPAHVEIFSCFTKSLFFTLGPWAPGRKFNPFGNLIKYLFSGLYFALIKRPRAVFIEGASPTSVIAPILKTFLPGVKIFSLVAEDVFYKALRNPKGLRAILLRFGFKKADYVISIGQMLATQIKEMFPKINLFVMYPKINKERLQQLKSIPYNPDASDFVQIGGGNPIYKGVDITISLMGVIEKITPNGNLVIIGYEEKDPKWKGKRLIFPGRVSDIGAFLSKSCLMIHPGRSDAFPVATLESMAAGVPPMISDLTGTKELVEKVNPNLIRSLDSKDFEAGLLWFAGLSREEKLKISEKCREVLFHFLEIELPLQNQKSIAEIQKILIDLA